MEILRRIGVSNGTFAEFGVGNGLKNKTLVLTALGWSGFWVGGEHLALPLPLHPNPTVIPETVCPQVIFRRERSD
jgi:hypothetical protein